MKHKPLVENAMIEPISDNVHVNVLKANIWLANAIFFFFSFFFIRKHSLPECLPVIVLSYETTDM